MTSFARPAIWLLILILGLAQLPEAVYTPSLPDIAHDLNASESAVEYTLTTFLFGFAIGTLFWGKLSDKLGRKPCIITGLLIFILGCIGCYFSTIIEMLMISSFIQAFGGSIGSVLGQAICRDAFHGAELGKVYSHIGSGLALFPAIGPMIGGAIVEYSDWANIFLFLIAAAVILLILVLIKLPETHHKDNRKSTSILKIARSLIIDKKVIGFCLVIAACNGISFSYFSEGFFYLINGLGLSPEKYGLSFIAISVTAMAGGFSKKLHSRYSSKMIMSYGIIIIVVSTLIFSILSLINHIVLQLPVYWMIAITIISQMTTMFGFCMIVSNALALALIDYKHAIGTASSLFGLSYYSLISLFTLGMGFFHNGTLLVMPLYFLGISLFMLIVERVFLQREL